MSSVIQAYRFALDLNPVQEQALRSHCGGQRRAFNWGLARIKANLGQRAAEKTYGVAEDELTPPVSWSAYRLRKDWNQAKDTVAGAPVDLSDLYELELTAEVLDEATARVMDAITTMLSGIRSAQPGSQKA